MCDMYLIPLSCYADSPGCVVNVSTDAFTRQTADPLPRTTISVDFWDVKVAFYSDMHPLVSAAIFLYFRRSGHLSATGIPFNVAQQTIMKSTAPNITLSEACTVKWKENKPQCFQSRSLHENVKHSAVKLTMLCCDGHGLTFLSTLYRHRHSDTNKLITALNDFLWRCAESVGVISALMHASNPVEIIVCRIQVLQNCTFRACGLILYLQQ